MIKLTLNPESHGTSKVFYKNKVVVGSGTSSNIDFFLEGEALQDVLVQIVEQENAFSIFNLGNNPFVTLNGLPFWKKTLKNHDLIQIGSSFILFENETALPADGKVLDTKEELHQVLENFIDKTAPENDPVEGPLHNFENEFLEFEKVFEKFDDVRKEEDLGDFDIDALMKEIEGLDFNHGENQKSLARKTLSSVHSKSNSTTSSSSNVLSNKIKSEPVQASPRSPAAPSTKIEKTAPTTPKPNARDYYLTEFDDENEGWLPEKEAAKSSFTFPFHINWRILIAIFISFLIILAVIAGGIYISLSDQSEEEELKAAEGIADVAMALAYAKVHNIRPQTQNWSDPEFLKNNLNAVATSEYPTLAKLDANGHLNNTPYSLRIYTSQDFSHFLVIAQPAHSLLQWLIPKNTIIVDSHDMGLRKLSDLKPLNRLLVSTTTLDDTNGVEISNLVKQGVLIPLSSLIKSKNIGFSPPKVLSLIRPGAENLIYNAPRYYQFGEALMKKAIALTKSQGSNHDISRLQHEISTIAEFKDMVLYTSQGMDFAIQAQKAITSFAGPGKFLTAYFQFNSKGDAIGSRLLMDDDNSNIAVEEKPPVKEESVIEEPAKIIDKDLLIIPKSLPSFSETAVLDKSPAKENSKEDLSKQLKDLAKSREQALRPISLKLIVLFRKQSSGYIETFSEQLTSLVKQYTQLDQEEQNKIKKALAQLQQEYNKLTPQDFAEALSLAGLSSFAESEMKALAMDMDKKQSTYFSRQLEKILGSRDISELDYHVTQTAGWLSTSKENIHVSFQDTLKANVLTKLNQLLTLPSFGKYDRKALIHILKKIGVSTPEENSKYLDLFDKLQESQ